MSAATVTTIPVNVEEVRVRQLRAEAAIEPEPPPSGEVKKQTQVIAIYGKGGIGKSFTLANLSLSLIHISEPTRPY